MKKVLFSLAIAMIIAINLTAAPISEKNALKVAKTVLNANDQPQNSQSISLAWKEVSKATSNKMKVNGDEIAYFYVFTKGESGFVMISGDDAAVPVLGYSLENSIDFNNLPPNAAKWFEGYKSQIRYIISNNIQATKEISKQWNELKTGIMNKDGVQSSVSPLIQTKWDQGQYYNALCPYDYQLGERTVTGCVATAMAQIMKYWSYPQFGSEFHCYRHDKYGDLCANFGNTEYKWDQMPNIVTSSNNAVATLMYHCGVSVDMEYDISENGGSGAYPVDLPFAYTYFFNYNSTVEFIERNQENENYWIHLLKNELNNERPIQYCGSGFDGSEWYGHSFICDGYDNDDKFHFNWGWSGNADGYFFINNLNPGSYDFSINQNAVIGIQPPTNEIKYNLVLDQSVSVSSSTISYGSGFSVSTNILNAGTIPFTGDFCAAVFDSEGNFVDYVETKNNESLPAGYHYASGLNFSTDGLLSMVPGNYRIGIFYRPTDRNWQCLLGENSSIISYTNIKVVNNNPIRLNSNITTAPSNSVFQGSSLAVNLDLINKESSTFSGYFFANLYDLNGYFVENIDQMYEGDLKPDYHYENGLTFTTDAIEAEPGTYYIFILYKRDNDDNLYVAGSTDNYINPIKIIVQQAPYQADIYEPNNELSNSYNLSYSFNSNKAFIKTNNSNFHSGTDFDFYKIVLPSDYYYSIDARLQDEYSSNDGKDYSVDAVFFYSTNGTDWSDYYDNVLDNTIKVQGATTIFFAVGHYYNGSTGTYALQIEINRSAPGNPSILLSGNMSFGYVTIGDTKIKELSISNNGTSNLIINSINCPEGFTGSWKGSIPPGQTQKINISFSPKQEKTYLDDILVNSNSTTGTNSITVLGVGVVTSSIIELSGNMSFGSVIIGESKIKELTISNNGTSNLTVNSINCPEGFSCSWSGTIQPGKSQQINISFTPNLEKTYLGEIIVNSNSTKGTNKIAVIGAGIASNSIIELTGNMNFGAVIIGESVKKELTISNYGSTNLVISSIFCPDGFAGQWSGTIPPGKSQLVNITFSPRQEKTYSGNIVVNSNSKKGTNKIAVLGDGTTPQPTIVLSGNMDFGQVELGKQKTSNLTVANSGTSTLMVKNIQYPEGYSGDWIGNIPAGSSQNITVTFNPFQEKYYTGSIIINSNSTIGTNTIAVSGQGVTKTSVLDFESNINIKIFPNPAKDFLIIKCDNFSGRFDELSIIDYLGNIQLNYNINVSQSELMINTTNLQSGIYSILFKSNNNIIFIKKIVVVK